jgi:hypothetical protein
MRRLRGALFIEVNIYSCSLAVSVYSPKIYGKSTGCAARIAGRNEALDKQIG